MQTMQVFTFVGGSQYKKNVTVGGRTRHGHISDTCRTGSLAIFRRLAPWGWYAVDVKLLQFTTGGLAHSASGARCTLTLSSTHAGWCASSDPFAFWACCFPEFGTNLMYLHLFS